MTDACPGCGAVLPAATGATHPYMRASPACWAAYGEVLAREFQDPALFAACHRFTVDAYALQHPGDADDRRARQSVWIHFASLHAIFVAGCSTAQATALLRRLAGRDSAPLPPAPAFAMTVAEVAGSAAGGHAESAIRWAREAHRAWAPLLAPGIAGWLD